ncbi:MAG: patatin-like phospholipase family protein, partial [Kineosporiaceae bacterium]
RGAYEMGALSVLLPWLRRRGQSPRIVVGTSAGAMNAVLVASTADLDDPVAAGQIGLDVWRGLGRSDVFRPVELSAPWALGRYLLGVAGIGPGLPSLLDVAPLRATVEGFGRWPQLSASIGDRLDAVAVIATAAGDGRAAARTDVFVQSSSADLPPDDDERGLRYVRTTLRADHVLASAAIPVAFPPVRVDEPSGPGGWYLDDGVRLNAPIKPALELGADRLVVVATHPLEPEAGDGVSPPDAGDQPPPDVFSASAAVLTAALVGRMVDDVRSLRRVNRLVATGGEAGYRYVPSLFVGPSRDSSIADAAREVLATRYATLLGGDYFWLNRLVGGSSQAHSELLSFLLFDRMFVDLLIELGRADAAAAVAASDPWS